MSTELEQRIRDMVERSEAGSHEITASELFDAAHRRPDESLRPRTPRRAQIVLAAAAIVVFATTAGLFVAQGQHVPDRFQSIAEGTPAPRSDPGDPETTSLPSPPPVAEPASTTMVTVPTSDTPRTLNELRAAQAAALAGLPGFSVTVEFRTPADGADANVRTSQVTMLADSSFWAEGDDQSWASYEPATQTERMMTPKEDGSFDTVNLVANGGNFISTSRYFGHNPTALVEAHGEIEITEATFEGRQAWLLTSAATYEQPSTTSAPTSTSALPTVTETSRQLVDVETGLVVDSTTGSTGNINYSQRTVLSNFTVTNKLPAAFPGRFPEGNEPQPTGNELRLVVTPTEAVDLFGLSLPIPDATLTSAAMLMYDEGGYFNGINSDEIAGVNRLVSIEFRTGFRSERVSISASAPDDPALVGEGRTVIDGYQCTDKNADGACDNAPQNYLSYPDGGVLDVDTIIISGGVLDGTTAIVNKFGLSLEFGVFLIGIEAETSERAIEIAETFTLID